MSTNTSLVVFDSPDFLIANKPHGLPTVPLKNQSIDGTLLGEISKTCPVVLEVFGKSKWEGSALHRLDTATAGLVLFAKTQSFYDYLLEVQNRNLFEKTYIAICDESCPITTNTISSYFRAYGPGAKLVKAENNVRKADVDRVYTTWVKRVSKGNYECKLTRGFRHQIRVHLSSNGCPIVGDVLYNPKYVQTSDCEMLLTCTGLDFPMPSGASFHYSLQ